MKTMAHMVGCRNPASDILQHLTFIYLFLYYWTNITKPESYWNTDRNSADVGNGFPKGFRTTLAAILGVKIVHVI